LARIALQSGVQLADAGPPPTELSVTAAPLPNAPAPAPTPSPVAPHQALRVAVLSSDPTTRQISLRILGEGEIAPPGSSEALLVSLDPERKLLA
jgi:hypothetical protein